MLKMSDFTEAWDSLTFQQRKAIAVDGLCVRVAIKGEDVFFYAKDGKLYAHVCQYVDLGLVP